MLLTAGMALRAARARLECDCGNARLDAARLIEAASGHNAAWLIAHEEDCLDGAAAERLEAYLARRERGEPIAYILGEAWFYGRRFEVNPDVLVPRPESEHLVELALAHLRSRESAGLRACDVGTGSGAIAVSLCCELGRLRADAIDVSLPALAVAERNARRLGAGARVAFHHGDAIRELPRTTGYDVVVANLPYVPSGQLKPRPDPTAFEPRLALDGGPDGLDAYRRLLAQAPGRLAPGGRLLMEAGPETAAGLARLAERAFPAPARVGIHRDYAARERIVEVLT